MLFLTDSPCHEYTLFCTAHAALVGQRTIAYIAAHPGVAVDPECADAWAVASSAAELAARFAVVLRYGVAWCTACDLAVVYCRGHA